jgi:hypothetical protein
LIGLRVTGRASGRPVELPVRYAEDDAGLVVMPGHSEHKRWWRNLRGGADLAVLVDGDWRPGRGVVLTADQPTTPRPLRELSGVDGSNTGLHCMARSVESRSARPESVTRPGAFVRPLRGSLPIAFEQVIDQGLARRYYGAVFGWELDMGTV